MNWFDLDHTLAIIEPNPEGCEYYFFCAPKDHHKVLTCYLTQLDKIRFEYTRYVKDHLKPIYGYCLDRAVNLYDVIPAGFNPNDSKLVTDDPKHGIAFLSDIKNIPLLSSREYQCLELYQQKGLTSKQIAQKIGISHRTIEGYFDNIKTKYHVTSKRELLNEPLVPCSQYAYLEDC